MARILITVPTWNEAKGITKHLRILHSACCRLLSSHEWLIEVVDNGSTDGTAEQVRILCKTVSHLAVRTLKERGKGRAIHVSWSAHLRDKDILLFIDADLSPDVQTLTHFLQPLIQHRADIVCGSRHLERSCVSRPLLRRILSRGYHALQSIVLHIPVDDVQCGYKAVSSAVARELLPLCEEREWLFDTELLAFAAQYKKRVHVFPVAWKESRYQKRVSSVRPLRDGFLFLSGMWRIKKRLKKNLSTAKS